MKTILNRTYNQDQLKELNRDLHDAFNPRFNRNFRQIVDKEFYPSGPHGEFRVLITWEP